MVLPVFEFWSLNPNNNNTVLFNQYCKPSALKKKMVFSVHRIFKSGK